MDSKECEPPFTLTKEYLECVLNKELKSNLKIEHFSTEELTKPGDNYGSTILAVEVVCKENSDESIRNFSLVAKLMPPSQFLREAFNINLTFNKEVRTYVLVCPQLKRLQEEKRIPTDETVQVFPRFYGARTNIQDDLFQEADHSAILLLENLKTSGYVVGDRTKGLDLNHLQFVVTQLARFHALNLAFKLHKPSAFKETVMKACEKFTVGSKFDIERLISITMKGVSGISECKPYIKRIEDKIREALEIEFVLSPIPKEPFATMLHNDFWVNNMLFKYETLDGEKKVPVAMRFVDFQIVVYDSPARDLLFFLFTSAEDCLLDKHLDNLIHLYHRKLIRHLEMLQCDTDDFGLNKLLEELDIYAPREFSHILFLLKVVSAENSDAQGLSESDMDLFDSNGGEVYARKVRTLVSTFVNRGWL